MALPVNLQEMFEIEVCVLLSRCQAFVAKKLLDYPQIRSPAQQMGSEGMAKGMGANLPPHG